MSGSSLILPSWILLKSCSSESARGGGHRLLALLLLAEGDDRAGLRLVLDDLERVAGLRQILEARDLDGRGRAGLVDLLAAVVVHRAHAAEDRAREEDVADLERAGLDEHRRDVAAARVAPRLEHDAARLFGGRAP